ncbi:hypothetical protein JG688_00016955, partial [Phytophthora aleatoria]
MKIFFAAALIAAAMATASADSMGNMQTDLTQPPTATYAAGTDTLGSSIGTTGSSETTTSSGSSNSPIQSSGNGWGVPATGGSSETSTGSSTKT